MKANDRPEIRDARGTGGVGGVGYERRRMDWLGTYNARGGQNNPPRHPGALAFDWRYVMENTKSILKTIALACLLFAWLFANFGFWGWATNYEIGRAHV